MIRDALLPLGVTLVGLALGFFGARRVQDSDTDRRLIDFYRSSYTREELQRLADSGSACARKALR